MDCQISHEARTALHARSITDPDALVRLLTAPTPAPRAAHLHLDVLVVLHERRAEPAPPRPREPHRCRCYDTLRALRRPGGVRVPPRRMAWRGVLREVEAGAGAWLLGPFFEGLGHIGVGAVVRIEAVGERMRVGLRLGFLRYD